MKFGQLKIMSYNVHYIYNFHIILAYNFHTYRVYHYMRVVESIISSS